jgi:hypothetical protein
MQVAFLILNHRDPAQLLRLVTTLRLELPEAPIVVHNDRFRIDLNASALDSISDIHLLTSDGPITWGDFSLVDACWHSMRWMVRHVKFDWLILLSAQDYPIKSLATLGDYLDATGADALLRAAPVSGLSKGRNGRNRRRRYFYQYRPNIPIPYPDSRWRRLRLRLRQLTQVPVDVLNNVQPYIQVYKLPEQMPWRVGWRARSTPFTENEPCWFGSMWWSLSYKAAELVVEYARMNPAYVDYYRRTIIPDESATATIIYNSPSLHVDPHNLHYVRWTNPKTGHPDVFRADDLPELLAAPEFFARKFDIATDSEILDKLEEVLARARRAGVPNSGLAISGPMAQAAG